MKIQRTSAVRPGFTLVELLVAMAITTLIVGVLVSVTSMALDTWNRSRAELRASRQAKAMIETMARDLESFVFRKGNNEWLSAISDDKKIGDKLQSTNAIKLIFLTAATDRYEGDIKNDKGGDVSCAAYQLEYRDPISTSSGSKFETYVLSRYLVNPDDTYKDLLGKTDTNDNPGTGLASVFGQYESKLSKPENFVCENIYQFTMTFQIQVLQATGSGNDQKIKYIYQPVTVGRVSGRTISESLRIQGNRIATKIDSAAVSRDELESGRCTGVEVSVTVLTDFAVEQARVRTFANEEAKAKFLSQNSYNYSKLIKLPSL
jgi:type II secretory pathway pseudopilin PulG